uniref:uncharacterized protein n=1 Tax=Semicossyphus pulcher TaxID=241346 RepID=UPI0037E802A3
TTAVTSGTTDAPTGTTDGTPTTDEPSTTVVTSTVVTSGTTDGTPTTDEPTPTTSPTTTPTSPTTHPNTASSSSTKEPLICSNGGTYNGTICLCLTGFEGDLCEFVKDVEPDTINRKVVVDVEVNEEYNDKYEDKTSQEYRDFVGNFTSQMEVYYRARAIKHFTEVVVISVSSGAPLNRFSSNTVDRVKCVDVSSTWYLSDDCSLPIQRTAFYAGLSVTLAFLLVLVGVMAAFILRNKQREKRKRDIKEQLVNQWLEEDFEWSRSKVHSHGDLKNPSFISDDSAFYREAPSVLRRPASVDQPTRRSSQTDFRPSLGMFSPQQPAHRLNSPSNNAGYSRSAGPAIPLRETANQPMRINRPQIRTSWDA